MAWDKRNIAAGSGLFICLTFLFTYGSSVVLGLVTAAFLQNQHLVRFLSHTGNFGFCMVFVYVLLAGKRRNSIKVLHLSLLVSSAVWFAFLVPGYGFRACLIGMLGLSDMSFAVLLLSVWDMVFLFLVAKTILLTGGSRIRVVYFAYVELVLFVEVFIRLELREQFELVPMAFRIFCLLLFYGGCLRLLRGRSATNGAVSAEQEV